MYPTLFPFGIGGVEDPIWPVPISFQQQANYCLSLSDFSFRYHHSFIFVVWNIIEHGMAHLQTYFTVKSSHFDSVADKLVALSHDTLSIVANHLEKEHSLAELSNEQKNVMDLLKQVNTIAAKIPGSQASKISSRNTIQSYAGFFGIPSLYFTANPNTACSPLFQLMCGDLSVNLDHRFPVLVSSTEHALRLAKDPVAAADFFEFSVHALFEHLFGWNFDLGRSSEHGGILGHLQAFYGTTECTERGGLHEVFTLPHLS
ncbi:hypothetical protein L208DRAFT_1282975 [Tricholoma matsutake]|nr:hypothetical protein L208DRAFT_1282975 [Tricholoma matsutake 945]